LTCDGTALVEAIKLGRNALAVARNHTAAGRALTSLKRACANEGTGKAAVVEGDAHELARLLTRHRELLPTQDPTTSSNNVVKLGAGSVDLILTSSTNRVDAIAEMDACAAALKPGGFLAIITPSIRAGDALCDPAGQTVAVCEQAGLLYWQHVIALRAPIRDGKLALGRLQVAGHDDVLVFRKPDVAATATARLAHGRRAA
jgi:hypothetical protein